MTDLSLEQLKDFVQRIEKDLGKGAEILNIDDAILREILVDRDYIFIIKMIATIEPIVTQLIDKRLVAPHGGLGGRSNKAAFGKIIEFVETLPLDGRSSKIEFAKKLDVLGEDDVQFIKALAVLRNRYAHHVRNATRNAAEIIREGMVGNGKLLSQLTYGAVEELGQVEDSMIRLPIIWAFSYFLSKM